jgi:hypothetical protein
MRRSEDQPRSSTSATSFGSTQRTPLVAMRGSLSGKGEVGRLILSSSAQSLRAVDSV